MGGVCEAPGEEGNRRGGPRDIRGDIGWRRHKPVRRVVHVPNRCATALYAFNRLLPCRGGCEAPHLRSILRILRSCLILLCSCIYGPSGWAMVIVSPLPCSSGDTIGAANVPSSYLTGVIACQKLLSHPFVQKESGEQATNRSNYLNTYLQALVKHLVLVT